MGEVSVRSRNGSARRTRRRSNSTDAHCTTASKTRCFEREIPSSETRRSRHRARRNARRERVGVSLDVSRDADACREENPARPRRRAGKSRCWGHARSQAKKLTSAGVQPPFADRLVGPPMRLRRWEKERTSVGLSRAHRMARVYLARAARFRSRGAGFARGRGPIPGSNTGYAPRDGRQGMRLVVHRSEFRACVAVAAARSGE